MNSCVICGLTGDKLLKCGKCKTRTYCSRECQKIDWKEHKFTCGNELMVRKILPKEVISKEIITDDENEYICSKPGRCCCPVFKRITKNNNAFMGVLGAVYYHTLINKRVLTATLTKLNTHKTVYDNTNTYSVLLTWVEEHEEPIDEDDLSLYIKYIHDFSDEEEDAAYSLNFSLRHCKASYEKYNSSNMRKISKANRMALIISDDDYCKIF